VTKLCCHPIFNHKQFVSLAIVCVFLWWINHWVQGTFSFSFLSSEKQKCTLSTCPTLFC
jgi:hypothetical protein